MAPSKRSELLSQFEELRKQQVESNDKATFVGWTAEAEAVYKRRADRIAAIGHELDNLDETHVGSGST
jgi:hypothetical protein